jgi:FkbM family methyltransferase
MNTKEGKIIYRKVRDKKISINCVCEVGVYLPETSNIIDFIKEGIDTILVEPDPQTIVKTKEYFLGYHNIKLHPVAIYDYNGRLSLSKAGASTFVSELPSSPALVNDFYKIDTARNIEVDCMVFSAIDNKKIELLSIDTEGAEWFVIKNLVSRPKIISTETHGKFYTNPYLKQINNWMKDNNYKVWYKTMSDTVYYKQDLFNLAFQDYMNLLMMNIRIRSKQSKRYLLWPVYYIRAKQQSVNSNKMKKF